MDNIFWGRGKLNKYAIIATATFTIIIKKRVEKMSQKWNVTVDGEGYEIKYINNKKIIVNDKELRLKDYQKNLTMTTTEYEIPLGSQKALLIVGSLNRAQLIMNGVDCGSEEAQALESAQTPEAVVLPKWTYIFVILHCVNFVNGLSGCVMAIIGIGSIKLVNDSKRFNEKQEIMVDLIILLLLYAMTFGKAFLL